jgi:signal transduction histidine kinase
LDRLLRPTIALVNGPAAADGARPRLAADDLGQLTASIAHEVNQPLTGVITYGDAFLRRLDRETPQLDQARSSVEQMINSARRASDVIARTRGLSKKGAVERARLDVNQRADPREINAHHVSLGRSSSSMAAEYGPLEIPRRAAHSNSHKCAQHGACIRNPPASLSRQCEGDPRNAERRAMATPSANAHDLHRAQP